MGRPVLLSFAGAAEIPIVPYVKTQDREAEIPGIPGIDAIPGRPGFPGFAAGEVTQWRKEPNLRTGFTNTNPNVSGAVEPGRMSFYLLDNITSGRRWYAGDSTTTWYNFSDGFSDIEISVLDAFGTNREEELLAIPQGIDFYIYHIETSPHGLTFRWKVNPTSIPLLIPYTGSALLEANFVHFTVHATLEVYNEVGWDEVTLHPTTLYNGVGIFSDPNSPSLSTDPQAQWEPGVWGVSEIGGGVGATFGRPGVYRREYSPARDAVSTGNIEADILLGLGGGGWAITSGGIYQGAFDLIPATLDGDWLITVFPQIFTIKIAPDTLIADPYCNVNISAQGAVPVGSPNTPNRWSMQLRAAKFHINTTFATHQAQMIIDGDPPQTDPEYEGSQVFQSDVGNALWGHVITFRIQPFSIIEVTPAIPPNPGTPPSPQVPPFGGTPDTPAVPSHSEYPRRPSNIRACSLWPASHSRLWRMGGTARDDHDTPRPERA